MATFVNWMNGLMTKHLGVSIKHADMFDETLAIAVLIAFCVGLNWLLQSLFRYISSHSRKLARSRLNLLLVKHRLGYNILLLVPGVVFYILVWTFFAEGDPLIRLLHRIDIIYMIIVTMKICNSLLTSFLDAYSKSDKHRNKPLKGLVQGIQVALFFVGSIIIVAVLIDKSPAVLLTGLGASAAVLMLVFKDSILGFVSGIQLTQNNMISIGDWIQMPDGSANGTVEEITLNTVKVRNWDNTLSMIPPYTLVSSPFKNWRGMQESGGRRADKCIFVDMTCMETCSPDFISDIRKLFPILNDYMKAYHLTEAADKNDDAKVPDTSDVTNVQLYRAYIEEYLRHHPEVNPSLDIIITQKEATAYGLPIQVYFFLKDKNWAPFERKQSDIFDHLMAVAPEFGLRLYQRP